MKDIKDAKGNILLAFAILLLLFTICIVMYSINWGNDKSNRMNVDTNITFDGGDDALSQELQYIIPFVTTNNIDYVTAYQDKEVRVSAVNNDILLTKGYFNNMESNTFDSGVLLSKISDLYGSDLFIVNKSFNVNGSNECIYSDRVYTCNKVDYNGILYKADRDISNINISDSTIYLTENILFYSEERFQNVTEYKVYTNGLYETVVLTFTSNDLESENVSFEQYIVDNLSGLRVQYQSSFIMNDGNYNWIGTVIL